MANVYSFTFKFKKNYLKIVADLLLLPTPINFCILAVYQSKKTTFTIILLKFWFIKKGSIFTTFFF